ncbi:hypothetical protein EW146_g7813 [Bondarzewia mesenterica]|uniref:Major facilitator superfamily (MFS) profile domain-containing protein n=1 Tax=Bondarzewia mesenterica TaxID=1095465 RepID=A0A4S4LJ78_9AGAM|nr:hypothetical protein EW146_g7813 [Bondarzewia mesenterica]
MSSHAPSSNLAKVCDKPSAIEAVELAELPFEQEDFQHLTSRTSVRSSPRVSVARIDEEVENSMHDEALSVERAGSRNETELAPVDTGFGAWSFLIAAVIIEGHVWSFPLGFGIFLTAYLDEPALVSQPNSSVLLPLIGTLSTGVLYLTGSAAGGLILPFFLPLLIRTHGPFITLRILAIAILVAVFPALFFIKPRLPEKRVHGPRRRAGGFRFWLSSRLWWILVIANTIQGFGYFVPIIWLPVYTSALNVSTSTASLALSLLNGFAALGPLVVGTLSDHFSPWLLAAVTSTLSCISTLVLWGAVGNVPGLMAFGATYGLFAGGWSTLYTGFVRRITEDDHSLSITLYGFLMLTRGLGNVLCTLIATSLANISTDATYPKAGDSGFTLEGGRFHRLILYVGMCYAGAALVALVGWGGKEEIDIKASYSKTLLHHTC